MAITNIKLWYKGDALDIFMRALKNRDRKTLNKMCRCRTMNGVKVICPACYYNELQDLWEKKEGTEKQEWRLKRMQQTRNGMKKYYNKIKKMFGR